MPYSVALDTAARRDLAKLEHSVSGRVSEAIDALGNDPRPPGCKKLVGTKLRYRVRVGDYRIIYEVYDESRRVLVKMIRHRSNAYR
jgi:mRNA interferase RelE/StbE